MLVDGEEIDFATYENKILAIPYTAGVEKIEVYGSYVVPEFGAITIFVLGIAIVSIVVLSRKHSMIYSLSNV